MNRRTVLLFSLLLSVLYLVGLDWSGLVSVDEPRYAAIGREMARSGDWLTPVLWGEPWFEKPPLLYWLIAGATRLGLPGEWAARLPVAVLSLVFLGFYYDRLRRLFGAELAFRATVMLATMGGWFAYSQVAVTDIPLATSFGAAMLLAAPWALGQGRGGLVGASLCLGMAILAKAAVPLVLALPLLYWAGRERWRHLVAPLLVAVGVAAPWYVWSYQRHGWAFFDELFLRHHLARFLTGETLHARPAWFYVPVLALGLFPWTALVGGLWRRAVWEDARLRYFLLWFGWGFVFFSASSGKLPGYLLPLLPAVAVLLGAAPGRGAVLAAPVMLAVAAPVAMAVLPVALDRGLSRATVSVPVYGALLAAGAGLVMWRWRSFTAAAALVVGLLLAAKYPLLKKLDAAASARAEAAEIKRRQYPALCRGVLRRTWEYQLNYYLGAPVPACAEDDTTTPRLESTPDGRLVLP